MSQSDDGVVTAGGIGLGLGFVGLPSRGKAWFVEGTYWVGVLVPVVYLLVDPAYYNKDDNFSQFSPIFQYAYEAMLAGEFPWVSPADYTVRLAQAPYYAIFSPILFLSWGVTQALHLPLYWVVNLWALAHIVLINLVLIRLVKTLDLVWPLKSVIVLVMQICCFAEALNQRQFGSTC